MTSTYPIEVCKGYKGLTRQAKHTIQGQEACSHRRSDHLGKRPHNCSKRHVPPLHVPTFRKFVFELERKSHPNGIRKNQHPYKVRHHPHQGRREAETFHPRAHYLRRLKTPGCTDYARHLILQKPHPSNPRAVSKKQFQIGISRGCLHLLVGPLPSREPTSPPLCFWVKAHTQHADAKERIACQSKRMHASLNLCEN